MSWRVYLAGPEVFLADAPAVYAAKKHLCERHGFEGASPLDAKCDLNGRSRREQAHAISGANESLIRSCDLLIANLTPFRSPSADVGTAYEVGYARALGKPVLGYTNVPGSFLERTLRHLGDGVRKREAEGAFEDGDGLLVESFEEYDNLMLTGALRSSGGVFVVEPAGDASRFTDLSGFERCLQQARSFCGVRPDGGTEWLPWKMGRGQP